MFDRIDLRGELPIGADAELYVNDVLRSGQRDPVQGRYEFLGVPLVRGTNVIKVVTYGPRGERYEQTQVINVGGGQLAPGETAFSFGVVDQEKSLFRFSSSGLSESGENLPQAGDPRAVATLAYGVTSRLTLTGGGAVYSTRSGEPRGLVNLGARTALGGMAVQADGAYDHEGGTGLSLGLAGQPWGVSTVARHSEFRGGFVDEVLAGGDADRALKRHTEAAVDSSALRLRGHVIPISARWQVQGFSDKSSSTLTSVRTSGAVAGIVVSGGVDHQIDSGPNANNERTTGVIAASRFSAAGWQYRGTVDYQLGQDARLSSASFTADRQLRDSLALRLGLGRGFGGEASTTLQAGTVWRTRFGDLALNTDYSHRRRDLNVGLRFAFGLIPGLKRSRYAVTRPGPATSGSAVLEAFVDADGDGRRGPGEQAVSNAVVAGGEKTVSTDARGLAFVTGIGGVSSRLEVGLEALDDPFLQAPPSRVEFPGRPGLMLRVPYPLAPTSEAVARVVVSRNGKLVGLSAVRVRLVADGKPPVEGTTEYDGSVHFESLRAGRYRLELDAEQAKRLGMRLNKQIEVVVDPMGGELGDVQAEVSFEPPPPATIYAGAQS